MYAFEFDRIKTWFRAVMPIAYHTTLYSCLRLASICCLLTALSCVFITKTVQYYLCLCIWFLLYVLFLRSASLSYRSFDRSLEIGFILFSFE